SPYSDATREARAGVCNFAGELTSFCTTAVRCQAVVRDWWGNTQQHSRWIVQDAADRHLGLARRLEDAYGKAQRGVMEACRIEMQARGKRLQQALEAAG